jgi:predicted Zn-dependent protease
MKKIITILLLLAIVWPGEGFSQKREKKKKHKSEVSPGTDTNSVEATNIFIDATTAKLAGETSKAIGLYESCLEKNPRHSASMYELAQLYFDASDYSTAARFAEQAAELEPNNKWYKLLLVEIYGKAGKKKELLSTCEKLVNQYPGSVDYLYELANAYLINNDGNNA